MLQLNCMCGEQLVLPPDVMRHALEPKTCPLAASFMTQMHIYTRLQKMISPHHILIFRMWHSSCEVSFHPLDEGDLPLKHAGIVLLLFSGFRGPPRLSLVLVSASSVCLAHPSTVRSWEANAFNIQTLYSWYLAMIATLRHTYCDDQLELSPDCQQQRCEEDKQSHHFVHWDKAHPYCSQSLWRVARGSKHMFLELIHGLFIT